PYASDRLIQTKWNGTVSLPGMANISTTLTAAKAAQPRKSQRSARDEAIAHIAHRLDAFAVQLGPQPADADVDDVAAGVERVPPDLGEQLIARAHLAGVSHEVAEQDELPLRQRSHLVAEAQLPALQVQPYPAGVEPARSRRAEVLIGTALDTFDQLGNGERLGKVVDGSDAQAAHPRLDIARRRQHKDTLPGIGIDDTAQHLVAVHAGQQQVEDDHGVVVRLDRAESRWAVHRGVNVVPARFESPPDEPADALLVVNDKHPRHLFPRCARHPRRNAGSPPRAICVNLQNTARKQRLTIRSP